MSGRGQRDTIGTGQWGEDLILGYLRATYGAERVRDLRADDDARLHDVDFAVGGFGTVEVKTDTYDSGNIALELQRATGGPGAFVRSTADWWFYVLKARGEVLVMRRAHMLLACLTANYPQRAARASAAYGTGQKAVFLVMLAPVDDLKARIKVRVLQVSELLALVSNS